MKNVIERLKANPQVSGYKINIHQKHSYELFFVKGKLETLRCTDTCDKEVTVYVEHDGFMGDAQFFVYPSTTDAQVTDKIQESVSKALMINNPIYALPDAEDGCYEVESNFKDYDPADLAAAVSNAVFAANTVENAAINSLEVFINSHTEQVINSRGLHKTQRRYDAMVEAIPTYNGDTQSVELYEQYNFNSLDLEALTAEIAGKMAEVKARYEAVTPTAPLSGTVILNRQELSELFFSIAYDLNYTSVYSHSNLFHKGDAIQSAPEGDRIGIRMAGEAAGNLYSSKFDSDGMSLGSIRIVDGGRAAAYYGSNRYGQYLGETPTGNLRCLCADAGTAPEEAFTQGLEVISMSGLQVDFYSDYIGGEVRLAYYRNGETVTPITGVSIAGKLSQVLNSLRLSEKTVSFGGYTGPEKAILSGMNIF